MAIIALEYDCIQTIAYTHRVELDTDLWKRMTGEEFDEDNVFIDELQEFVGWEAITELGGDVLDEQCENLREI